MMRKFIAILIAIWACTQSVAADTENKDLINQIKINPNYLNVTGTSMTSEEEATENAQIMLATEIEMWLAENTQGDVAGYVAKGKSNISVINTRVGKLHRAFAYVKKSDILPYYKDEMLISDQQVTPTTTQPETTPAEAAQIAQTQPTITPVAPAQTAPTQTVQSQPAAPARTQSGLNQDQQVTTISQPAKPETPQPENERLSQATDATQTSVFNTMPATAAQTPTTQPVQTSTEIKHWQERNILELHSLTSLKKYMMKLKNNGELGTVGQADNLPTSGIAYLIIADFHGVIRKYVRIVDGQTYDMLTEEGIDISEQFNKYTTEHSVWFSIK